MSKDQSVSLRIPTVREQELTKLWNRKGVKKSCSHCGYYLFLCPDVKHECPICGQEMEEC